MFVTALQTAAAFSLQLSCGCDELMVSGPLSLLSSESDAAEFLCGALNMVRTAGEGWWLMHDVEMVPVSKPVSRGIWSGLLSTLTTDLGEP